MNTYSNSKLWTFESCPEYYKVKYIDKTLPEFPPSVQLFLGSYVHESLEWLYIEGKNRTIQLDELIEHFLNNWKKNLVQVYLKNGETIDSYLNSGIKYLANYYEKNKPFSDNTIEIEKKIFFQIENFSIIGYIDRLVLNGNGEYEVHDYKTNAKMKTQQEIDSDRQLAFYHLGLQQLFGADVKVKLIWHFLAHNKTIESARTQPQLDELKIKTIALVNRIESTTDWPACGMPWCDWCRYKREKGIRGPEELQKIRKKNEIDSVLSKYLI